MCKIFLGELPQENVHIDYPGAMHHARWMSKVIYSLKIYSFRHKLNMNAKNRRIAMWYLYFHCQNLREALISISTFNKTSSVRLEPNNKFVRISGEVWNCPSLISQSFMVFKYWNGGICFFYNYISLEIRQRLQKNINSINRQCRRIGRRNDRST